MDEEDKFERNESAEPALKRPGPASGSPYEAVETEEALDLFAYWRVIRKRRWTILAIFSVLFALVLIWTLKQKPVYRATALLEIERESQNIPNVQELFQAEGVSDSYLETQYKILKSTSLARRVINQLRLDEIEEFNPPKPRWSGRKENTYQDVLERFQERLRIEPVKRSRLVRLSFESMDPELAARIVNTLASNYIDQIIEDRRQASREASEWLLTQLESTRASLEKAEKDLQAYVRDNGLEFLDAENTSENLVNRRLRQLQGELTSVELARYQKESLYMLVEAGDHGSLPGVFETKFMGDLTVRLAELKREHAKLAPVFTSEYPTVKQIEKQIEEIEIVLERERRRGAQRITNDYLAAVRREEFVQQAFEREQERAKRVSETLVQYNILKRELETNQSLYAGLRDNLKQTVVSAVWTASNIHIVDDAEAPEKPAKPKVLLNLAMAVVLGLGLGVGVVFVQEYLDDSLKSPEEVKRILRLPTLAVIPTVNSLNDRWRGVRGLLSRQKWIPTGKTMPVAELRKQWLRIDQDGQQNPAFSEAVRSLRASVLLSTSERSAQSLLVSSAKLGEGKTTIATNLAICLVQLRHRVLLIDGDMRNPCVHKIFGIKDSPGLVGYLTGQEEWQAVVRPAGLAGLDALVCGPMPLDPAELLSSDRMRILIREAMAGYSFVVVDSPPLLNVADSRILGTLVEGVLLVVHGGTTPRELAQRAQSYARNVTANLIGVVLNNVEIRPGDYY